MDCCLTAPKHTSLEHFICSKITSTLRNMTQYYGIIESVLLLPITWYLFHPGTSASLITWAGGPTPRVFHRGDRHSCSYTKAQLRAHEKAKNTGNEENFLCNKNIIWWILWLLYLTIVLPGLECTVYPKKYAHGFCFAVLCCGYILTDFPISTRLSSLALWQSNDCPSAGKATLMNMDKYFMWNHYERLHNHNKAKHNKTVCIFIGIYCKSI